MAGPNTLGTPLVSDYQLGRGILYAASINATTGKPGPYRDLGNCSDFQATITTETLQHKSSRTGTKVVDKEVVISQELKVSFKLDEINDENLALFYTGAKATHTNLAIAGVAEINQLYQSVELGRWYEIRNAAGSRAYDVDTTKLLLEKDAGSDVALVEGTDYTLDAQMGMFLLLSTAVNIAAGDNLNLTLTADATAAVVDEVRALTATSVVLALKFVGDNPANSGEKVEYQFHQVTVKSKGSQALIGDSFQEIEFEGSAESQSTYSPNSPFLTIRTPRGQ